MGANGPAQIVKMAAMLERDELWLHPWTRGPEAAPWSRRVTSTEAGPLGALRLPARRDHWLHWLTTLRLTAVEAPDDSLIFTLVRGWGLAENWSLYDADDQRVGSFYPPVIQDPFGRQVAYLDRPWNDCREIRDRAGLVLATLAQQAASWRLRFLPHPDSNPFVRMLILGAVATLELPG